MTKLKMPEKIRGTTRLTGGFPTKVILPARKTATVAERVRRKDGKCREKLWD